METVKSLKESGSLIKAFSETIEAKEQKSRFLSMFLGTPLASLVGSAL